jgi:hypothetical protein
MPRVRIPSIRAAAEGARQVSIRFPFVLLSGLVAAAAGCAIAGMGRTPEPLEAVFAAATLGLPLFVATSLAAERLGSRRLSILLGLLGVAALAGLALAWPHWTNPVRIRRYAQLSIGLHLLVAFLPWLDGRRQNGFWQYNRTLFLRFLTAALYSAVLYVGLSVAILAVDRLFGVRFRGTTYLRLWHVVAFVFNTWFFLGGVPEDLPALEERRDYPRALKVFSQFILIPLVAIYLAILTAYLVRVLVTGQWPSNWIGYLVSSVATVGILSLLLVHPLRDDDEHRWVGRYARWFYLALLPAVGMLLVAIWKRIAQYGVTEDRYFAAVLAVWLAAISVLFLARRRTGIRLIPMTLAALAFLTLGGPLGAYGVSRRSQAARLRTLLEANGVLARGVVTPATGATPFERRKEISSVLAYLLGTHGPRRVAGLLGKAMPALPSDSASVATRRHGRGAEDARTVMAALGMTYVESWEGPGAETFHYSRWGWPARAVPVRGVDYHVYLEGAVPVTIRVEGESWRLDHVRHTLALVTPRDTLRFPTDTLIAFARTRGGERDSAEAPRLVARSSRLTATLVPRSYSGTGDSDSAYVYQMTGDLYLELPRER